MSPLVAVITPTWQRTGLLLSRCIPSVQAQDYPRVEHIVVSDGPDPDLQGKLYSPGLSGYPNLLYWWLPSRDEKQRSARRDHAYSGHRPAWLRRHGSFRLELVFSIRSYVFQESSTR